MENKSCMYGGAEYSHGATLCSDKSELVCNNGNWEPTGKDCGETSITKQNVVIVPDLKKIKPIKKTAQPKAYSKSSDSWCKSNPYPQPPTQFLPKITIAQRRITINHSTSGGGQISVTTLIGSGGNYTLAPGEYDIEPGTYWHQLGDGLISGLGEIHSHVYYN